MLLFNFVLFRVLAVLGLVLALYAVYRRDFSNSTYAAFMLVHGVTYSHTGWLICVLAVFVTLTALLLTRSDIE